MLVEDVNSDVNFKHSKSKLTPLHWASKVKQDPETVQVHKIHALRIIFRFC